MRAGRTALAAVLLAAALAVVSAASGTPDAKDSRTAAQAGSHNLLHPLAKQQLGLRQLGLQAKLAGKAPGKVFKGPKGQFVQLEQTGSDRIFVIITDFGNFRHSSFCDPGQSCAFPPDGTAQTYDGPAHNSIPQPDRNVDNTTIWKPDFNQAHYNDMYFNRMAKYYQDQSSGRYTVNGDVTQWVRVPFNEARYGRNFCGGIVCNNTWFLIRDALAYWVKGQLDSGKTVAEIAAYLRTFDKQDRYDIDGDGNFEEPDGFIDHFQIVHGGGDEAAGDPFQGTDAIWSHRWYAQVSPGGPGGLPGVNAGQGGASGGLPGGIPNNPVGVWVGDYTIQPENGGLGVFAHEFAHDLGLPDEYDTSGNTGGAENSTGFWTLMSSGANIGGDEDTIGDHPTNMSAWDKFQLGWLNYEVAAPGKSSQHKLTPVGVNTRQAQGVFVVLPPSLNPNVLELGKPTGGANAWYSTAGNSLDVSMTSPSITLGAGAASLSMNAWYEIETCWDYAQVLVSTNGGTSFTPLHTNLSDSGNENGQNPGEGITGISGTAKDCDEASGSPTWVPLTADLSAYAGQTIKLRIRYWTDGFVQGRGFEFDDLNVTSGGATVFSETAENGDNGWTLNGFRRTSGAETSFHNHYYLVEYRPYHDNDTSLATAYNFGFLNTLPDWVEHFPYQPGALVWYWDTGEADNSVGDHPGEGLILPVDAHPIAEHWADGQLIRARISTYDSTFGLTPTDSITLHNNGVPSTIPSRPAEPVFNDLRDYWFASDGHSPASHGRHQVPWMSVNVPKTGTQVRVQNTSAQGFFMQIQVTAP
jgi:immune inhibitor A